MYTHRSEITKEQWVETSYLRGDNKEEFRERKEFGNRHAIFERGSEWGEVHDDEYNATDFPSGTLMHAANYTEEKTGIPKGLAAFGLVLGLGYVGYKALKYLDENF